MTLARLMIVVSLIAFTPLVYAAPLTQQRALQCARPLNGWQLLNALQMSFKNNMPDQFSCLFHLGVYVEFNRTTWLRRQREFAPAFRELVDSGFAAFLERANKDNTKIDEKNGTILIRGRMLIKYGNGVENGVERVNEIVDLKEPNEFKYAGIHSEREFHAWYLRFQRAIESTDKIAVAKMVCYPLGIAILDADYNQRNFIVHDERQFVQRYDEIITPHTRQVVLDSHWPNLFNNSDGITLGQGDIQIISNGPSECIESVENGPGMEKMDAQAEAAANAKNDSLPPYSYR